MMKREDLPDLLFTVMTLLVLAFALSGTFADPDLWGHVRFGQDILASHSIPRQDPYSFTSDRPWINHEWLAEVLMAGAYGVAGSAGLIALKWLLAASALGILWRAMRHAGVFQPVAKGLLLLALGGAYSLMATIRPQLFSMLLYTILLALLNGVGRGHRRLLLWMPVLFAFWANLHGGWIVGLGVLGLWSASTLLAGSISWPWAAGGTLLGILGTLVTPYGPRLWRFLWETVGLGRSDITEWQPLTHEPFFVIPWTMAAILIVVAWRRHRWAVVSLLIPAATLGAMAVRVVRLEGFFALTAVILLAPCFAAFGPARLPLTRRPTRADIMVVGTMCLVGFLATGVAVNNRVRCVTIPGPDLKDFWAAPEAEAITFLRGNPIEGRLLTYFDYGELAIWHLAPKLRVSYDGRRETVYSEAVQKANQGLYSKAPDVRYARLLKADYIWLPLRLPVIDLLKRDGWVAIFCGSRSIVLAREAGQFAQPAPWTGPRCFPGP
ncbi:MAG: hypothetical protein NTV05_07560 [Acidobacteria bacterium]|nr:hypothetical protein [Acidobacteriota bacterium]